MDKEFKIDFIVPVHVSVYVEANSKEEAQRLLKDGAVEYNLYENWESEDEIKITNITEVEE